MQSGLGAGPLGGNNQIISGAVSQGAALLVELPGSRRHEMEADLVGLKLAGLAGFDIRKAPKVPRRGVPPCTCCVCRAPTSNPLRARRISALRLPAALSPMLAQLRAALRHEHGAVRVQVWEQMASMEGGKAPAAWMSTHPSSDKRQAVLRRELELMKARPRRRACTRLHALVARCCFAHAARACGGAAPVRCGWRVSGARVACRSMASRARARSHASLLRRPTSHCSSTAACWRRRIGRRVHAQAQRAAARSRPSRFAPAWRGV